jgi:5-formyltetrahydrofolate cyclo-ligase
LVPGSFGILEPDISVCSEADIKTADLIITPGLSFDLKFNRLGYGGGYYDRVLTGAGTKSRKIALAFDLQILDNIPSCPHDCKVDMIITESNIYRNYKIENI